MNNKDLFFISNADKFSTEGILLVQNIITEGNASYAGIGLSSPVVALIISLFFGALGFDRMYLGQWFLGLIKLLTFGGFGIWAILDWFRIMGITRRQNVQRVINNVRYMGAL